MVIYHCPYLLGAKEVFSVLLNLFAASETGWGWSTPYSASMDY